VNALRRIAAFTGNHPTRAWTLTVSMAQGKSALPIIWYLCATQTSQMRQLEIAKNALGWDSPEYQIRKSPQQGLFRATPQQREPLSHTTL